MERNSASVPLLILPLVSRFVNTYIIRKILVILDRIEILLHS